MKLDGHDIIMFCYQLCLCLSYLCFLFSNHFQTLFITLRELSVLTSQRSLQQLGQRCFEPDAVVVSISLLKSKILGCIRCIMSSLTNLYNYSTLHLNFPFVRCSSIAAPLRSWRPSDLLNPHDQRWQYQVYWSHWLVSPVVHWPEELPGKGRWQIRLGKVSMMILGVS